MHSQLVSPNLHVVLIHYPLAMLIAGILIETFSFMWRRSSFRGAGRWMILIGALSAVPATFSGIYALRDVARINSEINWVDVKTTSSVLSRPEVWQLLRHHMIYQSVATAVAVFVVVLWIGASDGIRRGLHPTLVLLMLATVATMVTGAWFGGESIYKKGVAVETGQPVVTTEPATPSTAPTSWMNTPTRVEELFPPVEMHVIMAGITTAIALVSIGLSFRKITSVYAVPEDDLLIVGDPAPAMRAARIPPTSVEMVRTFNPQLDLEIRPFAPAARFWLLVFVLALGTSLGGLFVLARGADVFEQMNDQPRQIPKLLWEQIKPDHGQKVNRLLAHAVSGTAIMVLPLVLALLARYAPREKIILILVTICLVLAVAFQVWIGILLLLDTSNGPINHFNLPESVVVQPN